MSSPPLKGTVKSCGCVQCRHGKRCDQGKAQMKKEERAARHQTKIDISVGQEVIAPSHRGGYLG